MPLNIQQVFEKIRFIGLSARSRQEALEQLRQETWDTLLVWVDQASELKDKLERARQHDPALRCAIPLNEPLTITRDPQSSSANMTLIAADGSQIEPDRHASILYSLVNVGAIVMRIGSGKAPEISTDSRLLYDDEIYTETGMLTSEAIEMQRDIAERKKLLELSRLVPSPVVALTDGPVELWGSKNSSGEDEYRKNLEIHKSILSQMESLGVTVAGYVDKPGADLVVRLLEIARFSSEEQFKGVRRQHPLRGVSDRWLFGKILGSGQRSAVFGMQSSSRAHYSGSLAIHFFYLNVGNDKHPYLVRVEIPKWVAEDDGKLNLLHASLFEQCLMMGAKPYPYILHRAHEIAVVKLEDRRQVEQMLEIELHRTGGEVEGGSNKQFAKDLPRRSKK